MRSRTAPVLSVIPVVALLAITWQLAGTSPDPPTISHDTVVAECSNESDPPPPPEIDLKAVPPKAESPRSATATDLEPANVEPPPEGPVSGEPVIFPTVWVQFTDAVTKQLIANTEAKVDGEVVRTDALGRIVLSKRPERRFLHRIQVRGYVDVRLSLAQMDPPYNVELPPASGLYGTVFDALGRPAAGARICVVLSESSPERSRPGVTIEWPFWGRKTDGRGQYRLEELPSHRKLDLRISPVNSPMIRHHEPIQLDPHEVRRLDLRGPSFGSVRARVFDQFGRPETRCNISIQATRPLQGPPWRRLGSRTAGDDALRVDCVPCGKWWICATPSQKLPKAERFAPTCAQFALSRQGDVADVRLTVHRGLFVRGYVRDLTGRPVPDVAVTIRSPRGLEHGARSGPRGEFAVGPVPPGKVVLQTRHTDDRAQSQPVEAMAGDRDVVLVSPLGGKMMVFGIRARTGRRVSCWFAARLRGSRFSPEAHAPHGRFRIRHLRPGTYDVLAWAESGLFGVLDGVEIAPGADLPNVRVILHQGGQIKLVVEDRRNGTLNGISWGTLRVEVRQGGRITRVCQVWVPDPRAIVVPAGPALVTLSDRDDKQILLKKAVDVPLGSTVEVKFTLK